MSKYNYCRSYTLSTNMGVLEIDVGSYLKFNKLNKSSSKHPLGQTVGNFIFKLISVDFIQLLFEGFDCESDVERVINSIIEDELEDYFRPNDINEIYCRKKISNSIVQHEINLKRDTEYSVSDFISSAGFLINTLDAYVWSFHSSGSLKLKTINSMVLKKDKFIKGENLKGQEFKIVKYFKDKKGSTYVVADYGKDIGGSCLDGKLDCRSCLILAETDIGELKPKPKERQKQKSKKKRR